MRSGGRSLFFHMIRGSIPILFAAASLCVRFSHFRWQLLFLLAGASVLAVLFWTKRRIVKSSAAALTVFLLLLLFLAGYLGVGYGVSHTTYQEHPINRNVFKGKTILVMVPHQDDEINLFGGLYEVFEPESDLYVMYATNGDKVVPGETRIGEAANALARMGVKRDHIIFLGYGDSCTNADGVHMYNLPGDEHFTSFSGHTETYAAAGYAPYRESLYTRNNMKEDMKSLLLNLKPDVIFCVDFDYHHDHRALSLLFEETMGEILKDDGNDYKPTVLKGFGYSTAYLGEPDFYAENILSTVPYSPDNPFPGKYYVDGEGNQIIYMNDNPTYAWKDRIRFPVFERALSRTLHASSLYHAMSEHQSQNMLYSALSNMISILNGDKVFWPRSTSGLLYHADVSVSSGDGSKLTDFKRIDIPDVFDHENSPFGNLWTPDPEDSEKTASFLFRKETAVDTICLYDHPSLTENITGIRICFSDGSELQCGPLIPNGSATRIAFDEKRITSFSVQIISYEGNQPGLTEAEAYNRVSPSDEIPEIIKIQDEDGHFAYDYRITDGEKTFSVYNSRDALVDRDSNEYSLRALNGNCSIRENGDHTFTVSCGKGTSSDLALYQKGKEDPVDLITVRNPLLAERLWVSLLAEAERNPNFHTPSEQIQYFGEILTDLWQKLPFAKTAVP